jgi:protein-S-isoprenylcysteine O-methyltransferase Ste14
VRKPPASPALLVIGGEAWLFPSWPLLLYAEAMAIFFHLLVIGYEARTLRRRFGDTYAGYLRTVPR